jgi:hypothetical protein
VLFVLAWLFGPYELRSAVPIWVPFLIALGLELQFFAGAFRPAPSRRPDRGPQAVDRERYGYPAYEDDDEDYEDEDEEYEDEEYEPEPQSPRRLRSFLFGLGVIAALAIVFWTIDSNRGWGGLDGETQATAIARFSAEGSRVAEKPVRIRCDESGAFVGAVQHSDGVAEVGGDIAYLTPERCFDLYRLAYKDEVTSSRTARALAVLAHESWHLRGVEDEGTTECYALQSGVDIGRRLGLSAGTAAQMMRQQLTENVLHTGSSSQYLVPRDCRNGGRLDLNPDTSRFP